MLVQIITTMLTNTYTTDDLTDRVALMRRYYSVRLFAGGEQATIESTLADMCDTYTLGCLGQWHQAFEAAHISPLVVYEALDEVEESVAGLPAVTLYVPVRFGHEHVVRFGTWFREHVMPNLLLTIRIDARMVGGCGVVWNDVFHDLSLRYYMDRSRDTIITLCNTYTHVER